MVSNFVCASEDKDGEASCSKKGDESQFLYETSVSIRVDDLINALVNIYNGRLKVQRICAGILSALILCMILRRYF